MTPIQVRLTRACDGDLMTPIADAYLKKATEMTAEMLKIGAEKTSIVPTRPAAMCAGFANEIKHLRMNAGLLKKKIGAGTKQSAI